MMTQSAHSAMQDQRLGERTRDMQCPLDMSQWENGAARGRAAQPTRPSVAIREKGSTEVNEVTLHLPRAQP